MRYIKLKDLFCLVIGLSIFLFLTPTLQAKDINFNSILSTISRMERRIRTHSSSTISGMKIGHKNPQDIEAKYKRKAMSKKYAPVAIQNAPTNSKVSVMTRGKIDVIDQATFPDSKSYGAKMSRTGGTKMVNSSLLSRVGKGIGTMSRSIGRGIKTGVDSLMRRLNKSYSGRSMPKRVVPAGVDRKAFSDRDIDIFQQFRAQGVK